MTILLLAHGSGLAIPEGIRRDPTLVIGGLITGALLANAPWVSIGLWRGNCMGRALIIANCAAWALFMSANARIPTPAGEAIVRDRSTIDAEAAAGWPDGVTLLDHPPSMVAGRPLTGIGLSQKLFLLAAGPAAGFVEALVVDERYTETGPTVRESWLIAAVGFGLSTIWWATAAGWVRIGPHRVPGS